MFVNNKYLEFLTAGTLLLLQLLCMGVQRCSSEKLPFCDTCIRVNTTCHNISHVFDLAANFRSHVVIHEMRILRSSDVLYYSFEPNITDPEYNKVSFVNLADPTINGTISAVNYPLNLKTFDIDQKNKVIYLGGSDGVYRLDVEKKNFTHFSSHGDTIPSLIYKDNVYFVREGEIIIKRGNEFVNALTTNGINEHSIKKFVITNDNIVVFLSPFGLFATPLIKGDQIVMLSKNSFFRGLVMDLDGIVYAWWLDGIYKVVLEKPLIESSVVKVADVDSIGTITFDNANNFLFTSERSLFSLIKLDNVRC